ncbi:MAG: carboxypeptidase-like regulatory domain-containing protein [Acidobacteriota bacterium]
MRRIINHCGLAVCLLALAFCLVSTVHAQSTGGIKGKVRNMRGDTVGGATVTARLNSKDVRSTRSNDKGEFSLNGLDSGTYNIVFDAKGYSTGVKYGVEVKQNKTIDLGERLILQVDRGAQVVVEGSLFFNDGTSVTAAEVKVEKVNADGSTKKLGTLMTNIRGEFTFRQPEGSAKYRMTAKYKDATATKDIEVASAAVYRLAISLPISRQEKDK